MKRVLAALCALTGASGCYGTTYVETPAPQYGTTMEYIPDNPPAPIAVSMAPPAPRYEPVLTCGYGTIFVPGRWDWAGRWFWARGYCSPVRPGYIYVGPRFVGGSYYRAHWAPSGYGAPAYPGSPVYRPAPMYGGGTVVAPPPPMAPAPVYRPAPVYGGGTVVAPPVAPAPVYRPAPIYGGGTVVAPPPPVAPAPVYRPAPVYGGGAVVAPAPAPRPAAPVYTPPGGGYRPPPAAPSPAPAPGGYRAPAPAPSAPPPAGGGPTYRVGAPGAGL